MTFSIVVVTICDAFIIIGLFLYLFRCQREPILSRGWVLTLMGQIAFLVTYTISSFEADKIGNTTCAISYIITTVAIPFWVLPYLIRGKILYNRYRWNVKKLRSKEENKSDWWFQKYRIITKQWFGILVYLIACFLNAVITGAIVSNSPVDKELCNTEKLIYLSIATASTITIIGVFLIYKLWRVEDAYNFKYELKIFTILFPTLFLIWLILYSIPDIGARASDIATVIILAVSGMSCCATSCYYPVYLSYQPEWNKPASSNDADSGNHVHPYDLCLQHPKLLEYFKEYCVELWCAENIQFYLDVEQYRLSGDEKERINMAKEIKNEYLVNTAPQLVNIDDQLRKDLLQNLEEIEKIDIQVFDQVQRVIYNQMKEDTYSKFKASGRLEKALKASGIHQEAPSRRLSEIADELINHIV